jgi:acetyl-CoA acetyltransferase
MKLAREVVIVDYLRSPFSRSRPKEPEKDLLNDYKMDEVVGMLWEGDKYGLATQCCGGGQGVAAIIKKE